ncbi:MAG: hypothetical protein WC344_00140 [Bacilli bacterium]
MELVLNIIKWSSLGLIILLVIILFFAGLIGWKRGIFNAGFRLLFAGVLITIALTTVRPMVDFIGTRDVGSLLTLFNFNPIPIGEMNIEVTNVYDTLTNALIALAENYGIVIPADQVGEIVQGLVYLVVSTFVIIMDGVLIATLGSLAATIFWHALFKHFISKRIRKAVRVKGAAMAMGSAKAILVGAMLIFPFSSLINNVVRSFKDESNGIIIDNEMLTTVTTIVDAYDDSVLANVLFNWTENTKGESWDVMLMDSLTSADVNGIKVSLIDEIYNIVGIGKTLTSAGILSEDGMSQIGRTLLTNDELVVSLISSVGNSGLVLMLIPVAVELALNLDVVKPYVGEDLLDLSDVDWKDEINNVGRMYQAVFDTGLFAEMFDEEGNIVFDNAAIKKIFEVDTYSSIMNLFEAIDDSKLLSRAIPAVAYTMAQTNAQVAAYSAFLPSTWEEYSTIKWGAELGIVYDALFRINALDDTLLDSLMSMAGGESGDEGGGGEPTPEPAVVRALEDAKLGAPYQSEADIRSRLLAEDPAEEATDPIVLLLRNASAIKEILVGRTDAKGNPVGVDSNGVTRVFDENGNRLYNRHYALFDSQLLQYSLSGAITFALDTLLADFDLGDLNFDAIFTELDTGVRLLNYKKEYGAILDLMVALGQNDAIRALALDTENMPGIVFNDDGDFESIDPSLVAGLKVVLPKIDNSKLLSLMLPSLLESVFAGGDLTAAFAGFGLDASQLNWHTPNLGREFVMLIDAFDSVQELMGIMEPYQNESGDIPATSFGDLMFELSENNEPLAKMLDTLYASNIINEKYQENVFNEFGILLHAKGELVHGTDSNFYVMLDFIFNSLLQGRGFTNKKDVYNVAQWTNTRTLDGDFRRDKFGNAIYNGETGFMTEFISAVGRTRLLDIMDVAEGASIDYGELGAAVSEVFTAVEKSAVFSATFGDVLDMYVLDVLSDDPGDVTFNNVTDWEVEGEAFEKLCLAIDDFGDVDFTDIDFIGSDPDNVVALLSALADSQMFDGPDGYLFGDFFYEQLMGSLGGNAQYFYDPNAATTTEVKKDFDSLETRPEWQDEITLFGAALEAIQASNVDNNGDPIDATEPIDYLGLLTTGKVTAANVHNILTALNNTTTLRMIIYNGYNQIAEAFKSADIDLSTMNNETLVGMSRAQRQNEIDLTVDLYGLIEDIGVKDPVTGEYSYDLNLRDATPEDITELGALLNDLVTSAVFNSLDGEALPADQTVFKQFMRFFMRVQVIEQAIYRAENPKDIDGVGDGHYTDGATKTTYLLNTDFPTPDVDGNYELVFDVTKTAVVQQGYVAEMIDLVEVITDLDVAKYTPDGFGVKYETLAENDFESILNALNNSELLYDCVPNMISRLVNEDSAFAIDDINLGAANPFFHYAGTNYENRFPNGEISELSDLFILIQEFSALVTTGDIDLELLSVPANLTTFKNTLVALQETETFYQAGSYLPDEITVFEQIMRKIYVSTYLAELSYNQIDDYDASVTTIPAGIDKKITDSIVDFPNFSDPLYGDSLNAGNWVEEIDDIGELITTFNSLGMDSGDFSGLTVDTLTPADLQTILQKINALDVVKDAVPYMIRDALYNDNINFDSFSTYNKDAFEFVPADFSGPLATETISGTNGTIDITGSNVSSDGTDITVSAGGYFYNVNPINDIAYLALDTDAAAGNFVVYYGTAANPTTKSYLLPAPVSGVYAIDLSKLPYQYFRIEAVMEIDIQKVTISQAIETGEYLMANQQVSYRDNNIPKLYELMDEFYIGGADPYYDFSDPEGVVGFVDDGNSTAPILSFIVDSDLYQEPVTPNYKSESVFLYNILSFEMDVTIGGVPINLNSQLAHNARGAAVADKLGKLDDIINEDAGGKFNSTKEGDAVDYGLFAMAFIEGALSAPIDKTSYASAQDLYLYNIANYDDGSEIIDYLDLAVGSSSRGVVDSNFLDDYGHSLLMSELVAGQIEGILAPKYANLDNPPAVDYDDYLVDLYSGDYANFNENERLGFSGAVNALYYSLPLMPNGDMTAAMITEAFTNMFESDIAMIFYLNDIYPALHNGPDLVDPLESGRGLAVPQYPATLAEWEDIADLLIAQRGVV